MKKYKLNKGYLPGLMGLSLLISGSYFPAFSATPSVAGHAIATSSDSEPHIYNGNAPAWMAKVKRDTLEFSRMYSICTGEFLSPSFVITAAHCTTNPDDPLLVGPGRGGSQDVLNVGQDYIPATRVGKWGDIALLRLHTPMQNTTMVPLMHDFRFFHDEKATVMGYGSFDIGNSTLPYPNNPYSMLGMAEVATIMKVNLGEDPPGVTNTGISVKRGTGITRGGDSGGPLMLLSAIDTPQMGETVENKLTKQKMIGVLLGGGGDDSTFSEINPEIRKEMAIKSGVSLFNTPFDGSVINTSTYRFSGWGNSPFSVKLFTRDMKNDRWGANPEIICTRITIERQGDEWYCDVDMSRTEAVKADNGDDYLLLAATAQTTVTDEPSCTPGENKYDCVFFSYSVGKHSLSLVSPPPLDSDEYDEENLPNETIYVHTGSFFEVTIQGLPGRTVNVVEIDQEKKKTYIRRCVNDRNLTIVPYPTIPESGYLRCRIPVPIPPSDNDGKAFIAHYMALYDDQTDNPDMATEAEYLFKYAKKPEVEIYDFGNTKYPGGTDNVMYPFNIFGWDNIISNAGYLNGITKKIKLTSDNVGVSGMLSSQDNNGRWGPITYDYWGTDFTDARNTDKLYNSTVSLFLNGSNIESATTTRSYTVLSPGLVIEEPKKIVNENDSSQSTPPTYDDRVAIPFYGHLHALRNDAVIMCEVLYWDRSGNSHVLQTVSAYFDSDVNWSCNISNTLSYYYKDNPAFENEMRDVPAVPMGVKVLHQIPTPAHPFVTGSAMSLFYATYTQPPAFEEPYELLDLKSAPPQSNGPYWVVIAPEFMVKGTGTPKATIEVPIQGNPDCKTTVLDDGTWNCGLQKTPPETSQPYMLTATQTTTSGSILRDTIHFIVQQKDEKLEEGGNGGDGNGGGMNGKTGGGESGTGAGMAPPYIIFPATAADGALLSSAVAAGGATAAGLTSITGAAGAATGAIATVGITVAGKVIDDITPDWTDHGKWALDLAGLITDPTESYVLKVVNKDKDGHELGSRTLSVTHPVIIDEPVEQQVIPWGQSYPINGSGVRNKAVTVTAEGYGKLNCTGADEYGSWTCTDPAVTGAVTLSAVQEELPGVTTVRHYTVSVKPLSIYSPAMGEMVINTSYPLTGTGQPDAKVEIKGDVTCGKSCQTTVDKNGTWSFPAQTSVPGKYTIQAVMTPGVKAASDTQSVTYTVSPLVTTPLSVDSPSEGEKVTSNTYSIIGKGKPGHSIDVTDIPVAGECHTFADTRAGDWLCGPYEVTAEDAAKITVSDSETSESISRSYTITPAFTVDSPKENEVITSEYAISGRAPAGSAVSVGGLGYVVECQTTADSKTGNWSCPGGDKHYPAVKNVYHSIVSNIGADGKVNAKISRNFAVNSDEVKPVSIIWPKENTTVNANDFMVSGHTINPTGHVIVKDDTSGLTLCESDVVKSFWSCKVSKSDGEYTITASSIEEESVKYESEPATFTVAPEKVNPSVMSIVQPEEGGVITTPEYTISGKINATNTFGIGFSVVMTAKDPNTNQMFTYTICSSAEMKIDYPDWSCQASLASGPETGSEPKTMTITARESAHGSHDDSRTRSYLVVPRPEISAHQRAKSHPESKRAH
ncbi:MULTISPECIES: trypsin-like serine protease [Lelliottia]|uniref:Peptidase S1 domain-containing protein n=2 Tax=Lelliottia aquatilis TaxID=2080838 RepID=A0ABX5A0F7_9ENTR|nr:MULTISPECIES: trypsin-like serine protease [Lelliottia]POZ19159.1 hypothetical protein C3708_16475 [Lelliottia sp. 7254-16]POZ22024.1 hypothetical protein C3712_14500 [Lelliottia aquatilis]POZ24638.1 hypothetical protein C3711_15245 [Lelliottia aquatilis]POZ37606.1 hypothetical protein C3709_13780 [Lelliottia aquatilis]